MHSNARKIKKDKDNQCNVMQRKKNQRKTSDGQFYYTFFILFYI